MCAGVFRRVLAVCASVYQTYLSRIAKTLQKRCKQNTSILEAVFIRDPRSTASIKNVLIRDPRSIASLQKTY